MVEIERPLSISHVFSKQSVFYFIKLSALFFSPLMLYFIFNPSLLFLPACLGRFLYAMSSFFFDCFLAAAWRAVLHLLHYSYFDGHGQKGGKSPSYSCSQMALHVFSDVTVMFLPFFFFVCNMKKTNLYKIWLNRLKKFLIKVVSFLTQSKFY